MFGGSGFSVVAFASAPGFIYTASVAEALTVTEQTSGAVNFACTVEQTAVAADATSAGTSFNSFVQDLGTAQDAVSSTVSIGLTISESVEIAEYRNMGGGYSSGALSSGPFDGLGEFITRVSGDSLFCNVDVNSSIVEQSEISDIAIRQIIIPRTVLESSTGQELVSSTPIYAVSVTEDANAADEIASPNAVFGAQINERSAANATLNTTVSVNSAVSESANATASIINNVVLNLVVSEGATAQEIIPTNAQIWITIQENVAAADQLIARLLWEPINTFETTNWQPITTAQLELRVTVGGGFSSGAISSGPYSGLGGVTTIIPADEIWVVDAVSQTTDWALVDTIN